MPPRDDGESVQDVVRAESVVGDVFVVKHVVYVTREDVAVSGMGDVVRWL